MSGRARVSHGPRALPWRTGLLVLGLIFVISQGGQRQTSAAERESVGQQVYDPGSLRCALGGVLTSAADLSAGDLEQPAQSDPVDAREPLEERTSGAGAAPTVHEAGPASFSPATTR